MTSFKAFQVPNTEIKTRCHPQNTFLFFGVFEKVLRDTRHETILKTKI